MKKKILFAVVALILVICFPITSYAAGFDSAYWLTVFENATYYFGSAGYQLETYQYRDGYFLYYDFTKLTTDAALLNYLDYSQTHLEPVKITTSSGGYMLADIGYLWWLPIDNIEYQGEDGFLHVSIFISYNSTVTLPSGSTISVPDGGSLLIEGTPDNFILLGYSDNDISNIAPEMVVSTTVSGFKALTNFPDLGWSNYYGYYLNVTVDPSNFPQYDAIGFQLMCNPTIASGSGIQRYINPYVIFGIYGDENSGTIVFPDASNQDIVDGIEEVGNQIAGLESSLLDPDPELDNSIESQGQAKDEALDVGDEILDAMDRIEKPDYNQAKDAVDIYLQDYDVDLARKYLGFVSTSPYLSALVVLSIFFSLLSFVLFGKKA